VLLRSGDEIELGQVQLRFVSGEGEFGAALGGPAKRKRYGSRDRRRGGSGVGSHLCAFGPVATVPAADSTVGAGRRPASSGGRATCAQQTLEDLLAAAKSAQADEKWDEALAAASKAVAAAPDSSEQLSCASSPGGEGNAERFAALKGAADNSDSRRFCAGRANFRRPVCTRNAHRPSRRPPYRLHQAACGRGSNKASTGACDEAKHEAELVLAVDSANKNSALDRRPLRGACEKSGPAA